MQTEAKKEIRKKYIELRNSLSNEQVMSNSHIIAEKILSLYEFKNSESIFLYNAIKNEIICDEIWQEAKKENKKTAFPKVIGDEIRFFYAYKPDDFQKGCFGVLEPREGLEEVSDYKGLILVPGTVFDLNGYRMGYGKGFYDRFLAKNDALYTIGIAHSIQIVKKVPTQPHDICLNKVITEKS